jgi:hypothetical protein
MKQKLHDLIDAVIAKNQEGRKLTFGWSITNDGTYCVSVHDQNNGCEFIYETVYLNADLNELHGMKIEDLIKEVNKL